MTLAKIEKDQKTYMNRALRILVTGIALAKIGDIKNYASINQVLDYFDLFDDFQVLTLEEKMILLGKLNGRSCFFYKVRLEGEWIICE